MIALREFTYDNALRRVGDEFDTLHDQHAAIFVFNGMAREIEDETQSPRRSKRTYATRDMRSHR
jgi:hypothetical protein